VPEYHARVRIRRTVKAALLSLTLAVPSVADTLFLKNGNAVSGYFEGGTPRFVKFRSLDGAVKDYDILSVNTIQFGEEVSPVGSVTSPPSPSRPEGMARSTSRIQTPVIERITSSTERSGRDTLIRLVVDVRSNVPVEWFEGSFEGPKGNIWRNGYAQKFTEVSPGLWRLIHTDRVSEFAPRGSYSYRNIRVRNSGLLKSDVWAGESKVTITTLVETQAANPLQAIPRSQDSVDLGLCQPQPIYTVLPEYTDDGRRERIQGNVELVVIVKSDGTIDFQNIRKALGYGLDQKAIEAVRNWKFTPAKKDGRSIDCMVTVSVNFSLR
jgi:TonB family protein